MAKLAVKGYSRQMVVVQSLFGKVKLPKGENGGDHGQRQLCMWPRWLEEVEISLLQTNLRRTKGGWWWCRLLLRLMARLVGEANQSKGVPKIGRRWWW